MPTLSVAEIYTETLVVQALRERGGHEGDASREEGVAHARDRAQGQLQALAGQKAPTQQGAAHVRGIAQSIQALDKPVRHTFGQSL